MRWNIGVTGLNATDNPAPGTGVIRSLRADAAWAGRIVGLAYDALDTAAYDPDLVDEVHLIPYPGAGPGTVLRRLLEIHARTPIDVLIPTLDSELANFVRLAPEFLSHGIHTLLPDETGLRLRSKLELYQFCVQHGFASPQTTLLASSEQARRLAVTFPVAVKGRFHGAYVARSPEEAALCFERIREKWGTPVLTQQFVEGDEYDVLMLGDGDGALVGAVPMRKLGITDQGKAWSGVTIRDPHLMDLARRIFTALRWRGPLELEFVREKQTGAFHLIEINPRFPSWCYLSVGAGQNLPAALTRMAMGETVAPFVEARPGITFVRHAVDLLCSLGSLESLVTSGSLIHNATNGGRVDVENTGAV